MITLSKFFRKSTNGFTLVEMLVVISIIAILAALLMPGLRKALASAYQVDCANRLKQHYLAHANYQEDYRGFLAHGTYSLGGTQLYGLKNKLAPYLGYPEAIFSFENYAKPSYNGEKYNIFTCPADDCQRSWYLNIGSYSWNPFLGNTTWWGAPLDPPYRMSKFKSPSVKIFELDGEGKSINQFFELNEIMGRHPGIRTNIIFLDGHITPHGAPEIPLVSDSTQGDKWLKYNTPRPEGL